ncbi:MAG: nitrogen fixation protein FixP, partial [Bdellovibrionaceae bacterium]|nr:nitrogen fixation protein FixP [Pseudobdellovibrionaceae bacterium]
MSDEIKDVEMPGHEYDDIKEYDNPLPMWWLWTFFGTIIFSFIYWLHYEVAGGPNLDKELEMALAEINKAKVSASRAVVAETEEDLQKKIQDPGLLAVGKSAYDTKCASCH